MARGDLPPRPDAIGAHLPGVAFGWLEAAWFLVLFPAALWLLAAGLARLSGHRGGARELLLAAATGAAPVVAVAHRREGGGATAAGRAGVLVTVALWAVVLLTWVRG